MNKLLTPEIIRQRALKNKMKKVTEKERIKREKIDKMISSCEDKFIKKICELFINRWDCYAIQDNTNPLLFPTVYQELTIDIIKESLNPNSDITIGIHQIDNNKVKWLCYDIDKKHTPDPKSLADQIIKYLLEWYNLHGHLEPSGSPDSYHVWIFTEPTDVDVAINFHKTFKNRLKSIGVDTRSIEKGVSRGDKGLGCMIKLPFNIQRKTGMRSEMLANIFGITPEKIPIIQMTNIQESRRTELSKIENYGVVLCALPNIKCKDDVKYKDNINIEMCGVIISEIPKIIEKLKSPAKPDRSKLDYAIIRALVEFNIPKGVILQYLKTIPGSHTKVHDIRKDDYFQRTYNSVMRVLYDYHQHREIDQMLECIYASQIHGTISKTETCWHKAWKRSVQKSGMEIEKVLDHSRRFKADIYDSINNVVIEIQNDISPEHIMKRCHFYDSKGIKIRWIFNFLYKYKKNHIKIREEGNQANFRQICPSENIQCLFDDKGNPRYDVNFNIDYDFSNDTHTILKVEHMNNDGSGYGQLFSSIIIEKEFIISRIILERIIVDCGFIKINENEYIRKIWNVEELLRSEIIDEHRIRIKYKGYKESKFLKLIEVEEMNTSEIYNYIDISNPKIIAERQMLKNLQKLKRNI